MAGLLVEPEQTQRMRCEGVEYSRQTHFSAGPYSITSTLDNIGRTSLDAAEALNSRRYPAFDPERGNPCSSPI